MTTAAVDVVRDTMLTPLLALLMAAVNSDVGAVMSHDGGVTSDAIASTQLHPLDLGISPDNKTILSAYRVSSRPKRVTMQRIDHIVTLQFDYMTPSAGHDQLDERWPLLDKVWTKMVDTLAAGRHADHLDGEDVLATAGITFVDLASARKVELYAAGGEFTFPAFRASIEVTWRNGARTDTSHLYPALSFTSSLHQATENEDGETVLDGEPIVTVISYTPAGIAKRDDLDVGEDSEHAEVSA